MAASRASAPPGERRRPGVVRSLSLRLVLASTLAVMILYAYWGLDLYRSMNAEARYRAETLMEERRTYIRALVESAVNAAEHRRRTVEARTRRVIRDRVLTALDIAEGLWVHRPPGTSDAQAAEMIREALRGIRYDNGRGYFYVFEIETGQGVLHAAKPSLEGVDLRTVRDPGGRPIVSSLTDVIRTDGAGYYTYYWEHPNRPGSQHRKIAYVAPFKPLGWGIATGDYLVDITTDIKAETLDQLDAISFGENGYIFAGTWSGLSLLGPAKGRNVLNATDRKGVKVVQALIAAARNGGGFVSYTMPAVDDSVRTTEKLSYVLPVPEWEWYIGAGVSIDDIQASITAMQADIRRNALINLVLGTVLVVVLAGVSYGITVHSARRVGDDITRIERFLAGDGRDLADLSDVTMRHDETQRLAHAIRGMVARRDATEAALERQTRNLEKSNADLERFAYVASHDLREPLRIVASYVGLLRRRYRGRLDENADAFIDYATEGAQRMHDMIGDLLEYARIKRADIPFGAVPLDRVLNHARSNLAARIRETGARITAPTGLPAVRGQESLLVSLLQNLIENALKYRHPDRAPHIAIGALREAGDCILTISDNGMGIDPAFHDRIFQIFQRLHPGGAYPGTGVGLSICQSIVETHGGRIWLESVPDHGTTFHVALPLSTPESEDTVAPPTGSASPGGDGPRDQP